MAGTYGDNELTFQIKGLSPNRTFYTVVNPVTAVIELRETNVPFVGVAGIPIKGEVPIGTLSVGSNKLTLYQPKDPRSLFNEDREVLSSSDTTNKVRGEGVNAAARGIAATGVDVPTSVNRARQLLTPNTAPSPPTPQTGGPPKPNGGGGGAAGGDGGGADAQQTTQPVTLEEYGNLSSISAVGVRGKYNNGNPLRYPSNLKLEYMDIIKFEMLKYVPQKFNKETVQFSTLENRYSKESSLGTVILGIQPAIQDENRVTWSSDDINPLAAGAVQSSLTFIDTGNLPKALEPIIKTLNVAGGDISKDIITRIAQSATGTSNLPSRLGGAIANPNLQLLFTSPELRTFSFTFKLSPRERTEARDIRKIIRFFKEGSSVQKSELGLFLKAPNVFRLTYLHNDKEHKSLNKFKICALTSVSVDYTPLGSYMTFVDERDKPEGNIVSYNLSLQFQELEPIYANNYNSLDDANTDLESVGY